MEVKSACAGGICFCGCSQRRGDGTCWRPRAGRIWSVRSGLTEAARMEVTAACDDDLPAPR